MAIKIKTGSDFSGAGAFDQALSFLDLEQNKLFACDMDKYARKAYIYNYGTQKDIELLKHPDVVFCDDIYNKYSDKKLTRPTITEYKKLLLIQEKTANLFSFYYPWNVNYRKNKTDSLDLYMTSPPCQSFSLAGKRKGEKDKRGVLFYNSHNFIKKNKPRFFIFENVKGLLSEDKGKTFQNWLDFLGGKSINGNPVMFANPNATPYHVYYKVLNSKHFGVPQNRERVFIVGIRDDKDNVFTWPKKEPLEKRLKDVLQKEVDKKYYLSEKMIEGFVSASQKNIDKGNGFNFEVNDINKVEKSINTKSGSRKTDNFIKKEGFINQNTQASVVVSSEGISVNLCSGSHGYANGYIKVKSANTLTTSCNQCVFIGAIRGRNENKESSKNIQTLEINKKGTSNTLTSVQKDNVVVYGNLQGGKWDKMHEQSRRVYSSEGVSPTIHTMSGGGQKPKIIEYTNIRKLTPLECFRLMGFPDSYVENTKDFISDTQLYKQAGNSIVMNVLAKIIKKIKL